MRVRSVQNIQEEFAPKEHTRGRGQLGDGEGARRGPDETIPRGWALEKQLTLINSSLVSRWS